MAIALPTKDYPEGFSCSVQSLADDKEIEAVSKLSLKEGVNHLKNMIGPAFDELEKIIAQDRFILKKDVQLFLDPKHLQGTPVGGDIKLPGSVITSVQKGTGDYAKFKAKIGSKIVGVDIDGQQGVALLPGSRFKVVGSTSDGSIISYDLDMLEDGTIHTTKLLTKASAIDKQLKLQKEQPLKPAPVQELVPALGTGIKPVASPAKSTPPEPTPQKQFNPVDSMKYGKKKYKEVIATLSQEEQSALLAYSSDAYRRINPSLRGTTKKDLWESDKTRIGLIDSSIEKSVLDRDLLLYRGVGKKLSEKLKIGDVISDGGYGSTTANVGIAKEFVTTGKSRQGYLMRISARKGSKAFPMFGREVASYEYEKEFLLPRGTQYRIISISGDGILDVEIVHSATVEPKTAKAVK